MRRIRGKNLNSGEYFDQVFRHNFDLYDNYQNIKHYDSKYGLGLFSGDSYLDYGCGGGWGLSEIKKEKPHLNIYGVDISEYCISQNRKKYPTCNFLTVEEFTKSNFPIGHILSSHTLEHVDDPKNLAAYLLGRAGSTLTIIVPYKNSWSDCAEHLWRFNRRSFDFLKPTLVIRGLTNQAGNTEIVFHWEKDAAKAQEKVRKFNLTNPERYLKAKLWTRLKRILPASVKRSLKAALPSSRPS